MATRFNNAINALVQAFFNDTLAKDSCAACAVGNMVAYGFGKKLNPCNLNETVRSKDGVDNRAWIKAFYTANGQQKFFREAFVDSGVLTCARATGYSVRELAKVEYAFETNTRIVAIDYGLHTKSEIMQDQYNGLMAVVEVLCELEGIEDPAEYKELFTF